MRGLPALFQSILSMIGLKNAPWVGPLIFMVILALALPLMQKNAGTDRARRKLRGLNDLPMAERPKHYEEIFGMVADNPEGLVALADESLRNNNKEFAQLCVERLKATGKRADHVRRLERAMEPPGPAMPEQAAIAIERLLESGLLEEAGKRLSFATAKWPGHPELVALEEQLRVKTEALSKPPTV